MKVFSYFLCLLLSVPINRTLHIPSDSDDKSISSIEEDSEEDSEEEKKRRKKNKRSKKRN